MQTLLQGRKRPFLPWAKVIHAFFPTAIPTMEPTYRWFLPSQHYGPVPKLFFFSFDSCDVCSNQAVFYRRLSPGMDIDGVDVMLFGHHAFQSDSYDLLSDVSDEELLFAPTESGTVLENWEKNAILISKMIDTRTNADFDHTGLRKGANKTTQLSPHDRHWVIARVESILEKIMDSLMEENESLTITLKSRAAHSRRQKTAANSNSQLPEPKERDISFPGASAQEAWNFTVLLRILELVHDGLVENTIMTKRDIYYRHPDLFVKQSIVDRYVDDLACTLGITRSQLNVTAAAKGLVAGNFGLTREDGNQVSGMNNEEGMLVPTISDKDMLDLISVRWVLVIEKEATFRSLLSSSNWDTMCLHGIVLTAKGYPDINSRRFLHQLMNHAPHVPVYALTDLDPDGIAILSTYKYGSYRLAHEDVAHNMPTLSLPSIHWLGLKSHHLNRAPVGEDHTNTNALPALQGLMKLTPRDRTRAARMLEWDLCAENGLERGWRQELQKLLMLNIKAEMQILDELPGGLVSWIRDELDGAVEQSRPQPIDNACSDDGMLF